MRVDHWVIGVTYWLMQITIKLFLIIFIYKYYGVIIYIAGMVEL